MTYSVISHRWLLASALLVLPAVSYSQSARPSAPQLGKASLKEILAALTPEEKISLVVGTGTGAFIPINTTSASPTGDQAKKQEPVKVPGSAGRTHAIPRLGIPSVTFADGPAGVHIDVYRGGDSTKAYYATAFPVGTLLASSWDTTLVRRVGVAFGSEVRAYGIDVLLAPGLNIHRNPLGGRNFEYYSEDPLVAGSMAAALVNGVESNGVGTSIKHFAANNMEFNRTGSNSIVSERALREIYLKGFQLAVKKSQPWTVMTSYNLLNGTYTSQNPDLLTGLLRQEWGFQGLVMSDWNAGKSAVAALKAGNDLLMPGTRTQLQNITAALKSGELTTAQLDANVTRVLELVLRSPTFQGYQATNQPALKADATVGRQAAAESMVLLRNEAQALPLASGQKVALFGNASYNPIVGGTGSGSVKQSYTVALNQGLAVAGFVVSPSPTQAYTQYLKAKKRKPTSYEEYMPAQKIAEMPLDTAMLQQQAQEADVAVFTLGRSAGEGLDRKVTDDFELSVTEQAQLRQLAVAFHAQGKKLVVVLNIGGVVETASWRDQADAILLAWQPGQEGGNAIADVLSGHVNPSGKLATTFPVAYADIPYAADFTSKYLPDEAKPASFGSGRYSEAVYSEGIYVGYRYFNTFKVKPAYEFGYGLSYTTFRYGPLKLSSSTLKRVITATLTVTNTGQVAGREVVQLYVGAPTGPLPKPENELRAFAKTGVLAPGQTQTLTFTLTAADLASFAPSAEAWVIQAGSYTVLAGASSLLPQQTATFTVPGTIVVKQSRKLLAPQKTIVELQAKK